MDPFAGLLLSLVITVAAVLWWRYRDRVRDLPPPAGKEDLKRLDPTTTRRTTAAAGASKNSPVRNINREELIRAWGHGTRAGDDRRYRQDRRDLTRFDDQGGDRRNRHDRRKRGLDIPDLPDDTLKQPGFVRRMDQPQSGPGRGRGQHDQP